MPFANWKQQKYLFAKEPRLAKKWAKKYGVLKKDTTRKVAKKLLNKI